MPARILLSVYCSFVSWMLILFLFVPALAGPAEEVTPRPALFNFQIGNPLAGWLIETLEGRLTTPDRRNDVERPLALTGLVSGISYSLRPTAWKEVPELGGEKVSEVDVLQVESLQLQGRYHFGAGSLVIPYAGMNLGFARGANAPGRAGGAMRELEGANSPAYSYEGSLGIKSLLARNLVLGIDFRYRLLEEGNYGYSANDRGNRRLLVAIDYKY
ncbi:MAG: hypothetical protein JSU88_05690 [Nitrospinaceae bacterium]|nr:MAG: hypothetical protein JSU88_05690 [Nitrospinaceae bacterium]